MATKKLSVQICLFVELILTLICSGHWILEGISFCDEMARLGGQENKDAVYFWI